MSLELERDEMWRAFRRFYFELDGDMEPPTAYVDRFEAAVRADQRCIDADSMTDATGLPDRGLT